MSQWKILWFFREMVGYTAQAGKYDTRLGHLTVLENKEKEEGRREGTKGTQGGQRRREEERKTLLQATSCLPSMLNSGFFLNQLTG